MLILANLSADILTSVASPEVDVVTPPLVRREAASQKPICWISSDIKVCKNEQKCREQRSLRRNLVQHRPPKTNMEPKNWWFGSMFLFFLSGEFSGSMFVFRGVDSLKKNSFCFMVIWCKSSLILGVMVWPEVQAHVEQANGFGG